MINVVNLSGGKDSTAMLLWLIEKGEPFDVVIYMDMGSWEYPAMTRHLERLEHDTGVKIERVRYKYDFDYLLCDYERKRGKLKGVKGYGFARKNSRWCTFRKAQAISDFLKHRYPLEKICHYIGIALDEPKRQKPEQVEAGLVRYPLVEWGKTEADCLEYCKARGYDWDGEYEHQHRLSCWCCPFQSLASLKTLYETHPELWERLKDMQARSIKPFRMDYTLDGLERLFRAGIEPADDMTKEN